MPRLLIASQCGLKYQAVFSTSRVSDFKSFVQNGYNVESQLLNHFMMDPVLFSWYTLIGPDFDRPHLSLPVFHPVWHCEFELSL